MVGSHGFSFNMNAGQQYEFCRRGFQGNQKDWQCTWSNWYMVSGSDHNLINVTLHLTATYQEEPHRTRPSTNCTWYKVPGTRSFLCSKFAWPCQTSRPTFRSSYKGIVQGPLISNIPAVTFTQSGNSYQVVQVLLARQYSGISYYSYYTMK